MIDGMFISGFKAFPFTWDYLRLRPITLIFGTNGAGKSSLLQGLAYLHHLHAGGKVDAHRLQLTGPHVNLGGFQKFRNRTDTNMCGGALETTEGLGMGWGFRPFPDPIRSPDVESGRFPFPGVDAPSWCLTYEISPPEISLVRIFCGPLSIVWGRVGVDFVHQGFWATFQGVRDMPDDVEQMDPRSLRACITSLFGVGRVDKEELTDEWCAEFSTWIRDRLREGIFSLRGIAPSFQLGVIPSGGPVWGEAFLRNLETAVAYMDQDVREFIESAAYLGPWRGIPTASDLAAAQGEALSDEIALWERLRDDESLRVALNSWLKRMGSALEVGIRDLVGREKVLFELMKSAAQSGYLWDQEGRDAGIKNPGTVNVDELFECLSNLPSDEKGVILHLAPSKEEIAPSDTGVGISQVVPVLIAALSGTPRKWLIEQPELHLHPKAQAELGDLFILGSVTNLGSNHWFIVETHSEHLILRLLRRVRETCQLFMKNDYPLHPDEVAVAYVGVEIGAKGYLAPEGLVRVDESGEGLFRLQQLSDQQITMLDEDSRKDYVGASRITCLPVTSEGDFSVKWPNGFFEERLDEMFSDDELHRWMKGN